MVKKFWVSLALQQIEVLLKRCVTQDLTCLNSLRENSRFNIYRVLKETNIPCNMITGTEALDTLGAKLEF